MRGMASLLYRLWLAYGPRPAVIRRSRLLDALGPAPDERILEVGPGAGYYAIPVAQRLGPFQDDAFDAAFLVAVLGEIADRRGALRELRRVLRSDARLAIGEVRLDPHAIRPDKLREEVESEGFSFDTHVGGRSGYIARFRGASPRA